MAVVKPTIFLLCVRRGVFYYQGMERTREVAVFGRGREIPVRRQSSEISLPKRIAYGAWDGTKQFLAANSPEAWGNRILTIIGTKIIPKLTPDQQLWVLQHASGIEDAAMYMGAGITAAEIALAVVAAEKGMRALFPTAKLPVEARARERRAATVSAGRENGFGFIQDMITRTEAVRDPGVKEQLAAVAATLLVAGVDPTARDISMGLMSKKDRSRAMGRFERQFIDAFHQDITRADGSKVSDDYVKRRFFDWMNVLRTEDVPGHRFPEMQNWVVGHELALETALDRARTRIRKAGRRQRRQLRKQDARDMKHALEAQNVMRIKIRAQDRMSRMRDTHNRKPIQGERLRPVAWASKGQHPADRETDARIGSIKRQQDRAFMQRTVAALRGHLDPSEVRRVTDAIMRLTDMDDPIRIDAETLDALRRAASGGRMQDVYAGIRPVFMRVMGGTVRDGVAIDDARLRETFDAYVAAGAPGMRRILRVAGVSMPPPPGKPAVYETKRVVSVPETAPRKRRTRHGRYMEHVSRALEGDLDPTQREWVIRAVERMIDVSRPPVITEGTRWLLLDALENGRREEAVGILRNAFSRVMFDNDPNRHVLDFVSYDRAFDAYMDAGAPGMLRVLRVSGIPTGSAKNFLRTFRRVPDISHIPAPVRHDGVREFPGYQTMVDRLRATEPPHEVYERMEQRLAELRHQHNTVPREYRRQMAREIAEVWVDHAMPHLIDQPDVRLAFINRLEEEGFPGLPRMTVQGLQQYVSDHGRSDLPPRFIRRMLRRREEHRRRETELAHAPYRLPKMKEITFRRPQVTDPSPEELERRRLQSEDQRIENMIARHRKKRLRQQQRAARKAVVKAADEKIARLRELNKTPKQREAERLQLAARNRMLRKRQEEEITRRKVEKYNKLPKAVKIIARRRLEGDVLRVVENAELRELRERERQKQKAEKDREEHKRQADEQRKAKRARRMRTVRTHIAGIKHVLNFLAGIEDNKEARKYLFYRNKPRYQLPKDLQDQ